MCKCCTPFNHRHIMWQRLVQFNKSQWTKTFSSSQSFSRSVCKQRWGELVITISLKRDPSTACKVASHHVLTSLQVDSQTIRTRVFSLEAVSIIHSFLRVSMLSPYWQHLFFTFSASSVSSLPLWLRWTGTTLAVKFKVKETKENGGWKMGQKKRPVHLSYQKQEGRLLTKKNNNHLN